MSQRWWYLRRAVPWTALLGCFAAAGVTAALLHRWPSTALLLLPALLACCAAAAGFVFDEVSLPVVEVTPRGTAWRRTARLAVAVLPLLVWGAVVELRPGDLPLDRTGWWLVGVAALGSTVGVAAMASRRAVAAPGGVLATVAALGLVAPVVVGMFLGWGAVYPHDGFTGATRAAWLAVVLVGVATCAAALRPGLRR